MMKFSWEGLLQLIPSFIDPKIREQLVDKIDQRTQRMQTRELECANYFLDSEDLIKIHWGLDIYIRLKQNISPWQFFGVLNSKIIIPKLIQIANTQSFPLLTYEAIFIISNIDIDEQIIQIIQNLGLWLLIQKLQSNYFMISCEAAQGIQRILTKRQEQFNKFKEMKDLKTSKLVLEYQLMNFKNTFPNNKLPKLLQTIFSTLFQKLYRGAITLANITRDIGILNITKQSKLSHQFLLETSFIKYCIFIMEGEKKGISEDALLMLGEIILNVDNIQIINSIFLQGYLTNYVIHLKQGNIEAIRQILRILFHLGLQKNLHFFIYNKEFMEYVIFFKLYTQNISILTTALLDFLCETTKNLCYKELTFWIDLGLFISLVHIISLKGEDQIQQLAIKQCLYLLDIILSKGIFQYNNRGTRIQQYLCNQNFY